MKAKDISINLDTFMDKEAAEFLRGGELHKVAAAMERSKGEKIAELDLMSAVYLLGKKAHMKTASFRKIVQGLRAASEVLTSK
jgi:hypothetical protein